MRQIIRLAVIVAGLGCVAMGSVYAGQSEIEDGGAADASKATIYVEYREDEFYPERSHYNSINNELDRFHYLKRNFEKVFAKEDWPVNFEFKLYPVDDEEGAEVIEIAMLSFDSHNPIEVELRTWVKFRGKGAQEDFGVLRIRHAPSPLYTSGSIERDLDAIYTKLGKEVAKHLNQTIFSNP